MMPEPFTHLMRRPTAEPVTPLVIVLPLDGSKTSADSLSTVTSALREAVSTLRSCNKNLRQVG